MKIRVVSLIAAVLMSPVSFAGDKEVNTDIEHEYPHEQETRPIYDLRDAGEEAQSLINRAEIEYKRAHDED